MRVFVVLSAVLVCAFAKPTLLPSVVTYGAPVPSVIGYAATPIAVSSHLSSQYHAQDELGQYSYGYSDGISAKAESKSLDGVTRGGYSYVDAEGKVQHVQYVSDPQNGFRAAATNLPVAPVAPEVPLPEGPKPVEDTPEVVKAKSEHLAAVEEAKTRNAAADAADAAEAVEPKTPEPAPGVVPVVHPLPVAYSVPAIGVRPVGSYAYSFNTYHHAPALAFSPYTYDYLPRPVAYAAFGPAVLPAHFIHTPALATEKSGSTTEQVEAKSDE